jgi:uncharacterized protein YbjT (DUF2867 family)
MLVIVGASGKIGGATLSSLLSEKLLPPDRIICTTSSTPNSQKWKLLSGKGVQVRHATFDNQLSMERAYSGCKSLFLVSSPRIKMDFNDAAYGSGREKDHFVSLNAAKVAGIEHVYYTSLAFANPSKSNVMTAHERTEERLREMEKDGMKVTIIREGLYNESWPLYLGHFKVADDERRDILVAGDGKVSWTAIADLGLANALILAAPGKKYAGSILYLSNSENTKTLKEIAEMVSKARGNEIKLKIVERKEHENFYINERKMDDGQVRWWVATYNALKDGECDINDVTFSELLESIGRKPKPVEETIREMLAAANA